ncbi:protein ELYS-like isoform X3 [Oculina patagonica]
MKRGCSPNTITSLNYSSVTIECLERPDVLDDTESYISGSVLRGGNLAWLVRGATLEVINTSTGSRQASYRFGWSPNQQRSVRISSVSELHVEDGTKLLVGLKDLSGGGGGIVCIFDPLVSRVIKAIDVPYPVTVVEGVTGSGGAQASPHAFSPQLKLLFGITAIGTEQGHCYLVDLRLDDEGEEFDEWHKSPIEVVNPSSHDMAQLRNTARTNGTHLGIEIGSFCHVFGRFSYVKCDLTELRSFSSGEVFVTAIKYVRQTSTLLVGFNFGCFQMWNMETLTHMYSSQVGQYYSAVTHFMYQEPENDPRYCCYLWVGRGPLIVENSPETPATLTLYQLVFASRDVLTGYGVIYKELSGVGRRFEHQLTADAHHLADATSVGSKIICCCTLEKDGSSFDSPRMDEGGTAETDHVRDLTLAMCVWEAPAHDVNSRPTCHLGIFDINCWYHSQMPPSIRDAMFGSKDPTCPFFAFFSLADILDAASPDGIVDVFVDAKSISNFVSSAGSTLEQHLWPASLKFDACCLLETGLVHSKFLGVQRQILANMSKQGISCLSDAHEYFNMCYVAGLLPRNFDLSKPQDKSFHHEALLSVALEHGLVTFITMCIQKLGAGNVTHAGCSLKLILDWAWDRVVDIKDQLDQLCVPLFDGGGGTPDEQMLSMLDNQKVQLAHLTTIFQCLITQSAPITQQGVNDLEARYNVVSILSMYLRVVLWLIGQGLLPEQSEGSIAASKRGHCYPAVTLSSACESRRKDLENLCGDDPGSGGLMVDKLITQFGYQAVSQWISKGGSQQYPPSSLHGLCSLYLLENVHPTWKHCFVFYLLLDLCLLDTELQRNEVASKFAKAFNMSEDLIKLVQGFWMLDHQHFEAAVTNLVDPVIKTELGPWQRSFIIKTMLAQGESQKALYLIKVMCPTVQGFSDVKLFITVLLACGNVTEAFTFQKNHQNQVRIKELLYHFFSGCQQTQNMSKLLQLSLDSVEEEFLVNFLQEETFPYSKELLVMHYLQRGRYVEGIRLNELLKKDKKSQQDERAKVRNALVDGYIRCLPRVQRKLVFGPDKPLARQPITLTEVPRPKPLSTVVHKVDKGNPVSRAVILSSTMDKVEELRSVEQFECQRDAEAFVCTPVTPKIKARLRDSNKVGVVFASVTKRPSEDTMSPVAENRTSPRTVTSPTFLDKRRRQFFSGAEALSLLATPPVVKVKPMAAGSSMTKTEAVNIATPQSILKITRVLRRTSPQPSPTSSPPTTRRGSSDQLLSKAVETHESETPVQSEELATPSRRIRFASENASSSPSTSPIKQLDASTPVLQEETVDSPPSDVSGGMDAMDVNKKTQEHTPQLLTDLQPDVQVEGEDVTCHEVEESEDQEEAELQITAAVMDLTGDSDIEEPHDEDYSSYELDDSDAVLDPESDDESAGDSSVILQPQITSVTVHQTTDTSAQLSPVGEPQSSTEKTPSPAHTKELPRTVLEPVLDNSAISPPTSPSRSPHTQPSSPQAPALEFSEKQSPDAVQERTPEKVSHRTPLETNELSYAFSPPAVLQTPEKEGESSTQELSTPSLQYIFSPPLTRSMARRRSSGITPTDFYESSEEARKFTPHQSPSNSPISFVSPVPHPASSPRSSRKKVVRLPMHSMTLRARKCPARPTRAAKLPHTKLM